MNSLISVIVPNYNYQDYIEKCVKSVLSQTYSNLECIVVDDGSKDNSLKVIEEIQKTDSRVKIIKKKNEGLSSARNEGLKNSTGDYIAFIDSDDIWLENKLANQLSIFDLYPDIDIVFSNYTSLMPDGSTEKFIHQFSDLQILNFIKQNPVSGSASSVLMKRLVFDKIGFFDTALKSTEDLDYWFRCIAYGFKFKHCPCYDVILRIHNLSMTTKARTMNINNYIVLNKQIRIIKKLSFKIDKSEFEKLVNEKLNMIRWYARDNFDFITIIRTYLSQYKFSGLIILYTKKNWLDLKYDFYLFLKASFKPLNKDTHKN